MSSPEYVELWNSIHKSKDLTKQGWYQPVPHDSLKFLEENKISSEARILDVGGGDSLLVDHLLESGYQNITVLDISSAAIEKAKNRLGKKAYKVTWVNSDILDYQPEDKIDVWHDRATLHFLLSDSDVNKYMSILKKCAGPSFRSMIATFSEKGPTKCSGIPIKQYSLEYLCDLLEPEFHFSFAYSPVHLTPSGSSQNYSIAWFQ